MLVVQANQLQILTMENGKQLLAAAQTYCIILLNVYIII